MNSTTVVRTEIDTVTVYTTITTSSPSGAAPSTTTPFSTLTMSSQTPTTTAIGADIYCPSAENSTQPIVIGQAAYLFVIFCDVEFDETPIFPPTNISSFRGCIDLCALYNSASGGTNPSCKGVSFDGEACAMFSIASENDLIDSPGIDSAILYQEIVSNNSTVNETISNTFTITAPPTVVAASTTSFSGCSGTTVIESNGDESYTLTCSSYSSWFTEIIQANTTIYQATTIIERGGSAGAAATSGATGTGGVSGLVSTASAASPTFISNATGGISSPIVTYITTIISNSSTVIESTFYVSTGSSGAFGVGGVTTPYTTAIISNVSTIVETFSTNISGLISSGTATGEIFSSPPVSYYNTTITTGTTIINNSTAFETSVFSTANGVSKILIQL